MSGTDRIVAEAIKRFNDLLLEQQQRIAGIAPGKTVENDRQQAVTIGVIPGDGIGPTIMRHTVAVLKCLLAKQLQAGTINIRHIDGMTIEKRQQSGQTVPGQVLAEIKQCQVILKGPTSTPSALDNRPMESANVTLRRELDLFANIRPIVVPEKGINWVLFRENTEGGYTLGSQGINFPDWALDFVVTSRAGSLRIARAAFEFARKNNRRKVSVVTKANIIKATDGLFLSAAREVAKDYPEITVDDWYVDIMAANLVNSQLQSSFEVLLLPNLYGDIISDEAAQIQGGVGTAGSANIGDKFAMFEAVHGSAPRLVELGLSEYADPSGSLNACVLMLEHLGEKAAATMLQQAVLDAGNEVTVDGSKENAQGSQLAALIIEKLQAAVS